MIEIRPIHNGVPPRPASSSLFTHENPIRRAVHEVPAESQTSRGPIGEGDAAPRVERQFETQISIGRTSTKKKVAFGGDEVPATTMSSSSFEINDPGVSRVECDEPRGRSSLSTHETRFLRRAVIMTIGMVGLMFCFCYMSLLGGKIGYRCVISVVVVASYGGIDVCIMMMREDSNELGFSDFFKRGSCWLGIAALKTALDAGFYITFKPMHEGTWQLLPLGFLSMSRFLIDIWLVGRQMLKSHLDPKNQVWRWWIVTLTSDLLIHVGKCSPYATIAWIGGFVGLLWCTLGIFYIVKISHASADRSEVRFGYVLYTSFSMFGGQFLTLRMASSPTQRMPMIVERGSKALLLILFQFVSLRVAIPAAKMAFGDHDRRKLWSFVIPALIFGLEIGSATLFLGSRVNEWDFLVLVAIQEINSVFKNVGIYVMLYIQFWEILKRPLPREIVSRMEERRGSDLG